MDRGRLGMTLRKILIANRGEIAYRIIRTCRDMGIFTVAVYSDADANALHVQQADEAVYIGGNSATDSYLNGEAILNAAKRTHAEAIHPAYGFLAENADFAQIVIDAGLTWIGATPDSIRAMGKKRESKLMLQGVPLIAGYQAESQEDSVLIHAAKDIGYPVMVKASAGGGGKGMRRVDSADALPDALQIARREAKQAFGDDTLILEKFVQNPRHIEIQILGDTHGNVIAIGERECSIQRRHQKIIEETPSPALDDELRTKMSAVAVSIGEQLRYIGAGTVEFLLDADKNFYFMEMNTRLQVEHPVTEMVYGLDLVAWQIRITEGESIASIHLSPDGHAVEVRVYAEDPQRDFLPATGTIHLWQSPQGLSGVRVDDGICTGDEVSIHYDPMIAKIITHGRTRADSLRKMRYALSKTALLGVQNNIGFLNRVFDDSDFIAGDIHTGFIDNHPDLQQVNALPYAVLIAVAGAKITASGGWGWRNNRYRAISHTFTYGDEAHPVMLMPHPDGTFTVTVAEQDYSVQFGDESLTIDGHQISVMMAVSGAEYWASYDGETYLLTWQTPLPDAGQRANSAGSLRAPMPGQVIRIHVEMGQQVEAGDVLVSLEAMKMEHRIEAPYGGVVKAIYYQLGDTVQADAILLDVEGS
jgi:acetyl-CoA carboxylase biotin carboxylase subunit